MAAPARDKPWRLIWLGGQIVVRDQDANVWILSNLRKQFVSRAPLFSCHSNLVAVLLKLLCLNQGKAVNKIASYADKTDGRLQIYFSHVGFVYQKGSWNAPFQRYVMRAIRKDEHGYALLDVLEHGHSVQDMFNGEMKRLADQHVRSHGLTW